MKRLSILFLCLFPAILALHCTQPSQLANNTGGSEVVGKLVTVSNNPVKNAKVFAYKIPGDTSKKVPATDTIPFATVASNENGEYTFKDLDTGYYNFFGIAVESGDTLRSFHGNIHNDSIAPDKKPPHIVPVGTDTMHAPGKIKGRVILEPGDSTLILCHIPGSSFISFSDKTGAFTISSVPPGVYLLNYDDISGRYQSALDSGVVVKQDDTVNLKPKALVLSTVGNPPAPKGVVASYDTVLGKVTLTWNKVNVADLREYIVYRQDDGVGAFLPVDTVSKPDTVSNDIVYADPSDTSDHSYSYEVYSQDIGGDRSDHSDIVTVTVVPPSKLRTFLSLSSLNTIKDSAAVLDKISIIASYDNKSTKVRKLFWYIEKPDSLVDSAVCGSTNGFDTLRWSWKQTGVKTVYVTSLDEANRSWTDSITISIVRDMPIVRYCSKDTSIDYGGSIQCSLQVAHRFGACTLFVDLNHDGKFEVKRTALTYDTLFSANTDTTWGKIKIRIKDGHGNTLDTGFTVTIGPAPLHNHWEECLPMPTARKLLSVCVINKTLYAIGGYKRYYNGSQYVFRAVNSFEAFDSTWTIKDSMKTARSEFISAVYNNKIYVFGGQGIRAPVQTIEQYDTQTNSWTVIGNMPFARVGAASCVVGDKMYLFGGRIPISVADDSVCDGIFSYDFTNNQWSGEIGKMNNPRYAFQAVMSNSKVFLLGGFGGSQYSSESGALADVEIFDPQSGQCAAAPQTMPAPRYNFAAVSLNDSLFVIGGVDDKENVLNDIVKRNPDNGAWENKTIFPAPHPEGRHSLSAGVLKGDFIIVGGGTALSKEVNGCVDNVVRRYYP
jgi:N-acetylneuraminic acid mutarotase